MNIEEYRDFFFFFPSVTEEFPFDNQTLVFKVAGKMFALAGIDLFASVNLKCDPERAIELREQHDAITPGFHMNKKHWNTVIVDGTISNSLFKELIQHSYDLVVAGLTKKARDEMNSFL